MILITLPEKEAEELHKALIAKFPDTRFCFDLLSVNDGLIDLEANIPIEYGQMDHIDGFVQGWLARPVLNPRAVSLIRESINLRIASLTSVKTFFGSREGTEVLDKGIAELEALLQEMPG